MFARNVGEPDYIVSLFIVTAVRISNPITSFPCETLRRRSVLHVINFHFSKKDELLRLSGASVGLQLVNKTTLLAVLTRNLGTTFHVPDLNSNLQR
jgi:hypothetical protein